MANAITNRSEDTQSPVSMGTAVERRGSAPSSIPRCLAQADVLLAPAWALGAATGRGWVAAMRALLVFPRSLRSSSSGGLR